MRILTVLLAAAALACEPMTPATLVEPGAGPPDPAGDNMIARAAGASETERCGVQLDADSTGTSAYVIPHGDSLPRLWPATLTVEESDTIRFRVAPQEGSLSSANNVRSWSMPNWEHDCRRNGWECTEYYAGLNPLFPDHSFDLWAEGSSWRQFNNGDYSNKTYEYVLTEYLQKVPLEGRKCDAQNRHCVGDETVRQIKLDVGFGEDGGWGGSNAYGCHVIVNIVTDGGIARGYTVAGDPDFTVYHDPGPTIVIYTTYQQQSEAQRRRLEDGIKLLTAYGIGFHTLEASQTSINYFAGTGDQAAVTPRFFLHNPWETRGW